MPPPQPPSGNWDRVQDLFELMLSAADGQAVLAAERDPVIVAAARKLYDDHCRAGAEKFLEEPAGRVHGLDPEQLQHTFTLPGTGSAPESASRPLPASIGNYRILRLLGEGGMGAVYEAEQEQPRRTVALKVIKSAWAGPALLRRFERESEALARLHHPGIAQIYEAGTADTGFGSQPFFAMELIHGKPLGQYAEEHHFSVRQRLALMASICDSVQHAHQRGIIHRDLKPDNILVDEHGQPKILDFGLALVTDGDLQATRQTDVGQLLGTLAYMSPEQVLADPAALDTRSDVYALGVILYELLAGKLPYTITRQLHEVAHTIQYQDPAPLSSVSRGFRGDIETIAGKALEKDKARRYASAAELAADIRRHLADQPILATAPSATYQLRKFARRHKLLVGAAAAVIVVLVSGVVASTSEAARARKAEQSANRQRDRAVTAENQAVQDRNRALAAENHAEQARNGAVASEASAIRERNVAIEQKRRADAETARATAVRDFLSEDLLGQAGMRAQTTPDQEPDTGLTVRTALDRASKRIEGKFPSQPLVEAYLRWTIAETYWDLGVAADAQRHMRRAAELYQRVHGPNHPDSIEAQISLGNVLGQTGGDKAEMEAIYTKALETSRRVLGGNHPSTLYAMRLLGSLYNKTGRTAEARDLLTKAVEQERRLFGEEGGRTLITKRLLAGVYRSEHRYEEAEKLFLAVLDSCRRTMGEQHRQTLSAMIDLVTLYQLQSRFADAEPLAQKLFETYLRYWGAGDPKTQNAAQSLANVYYSQRKFAEAERVLSQMAELLRSTAGPGDVRTLRASRALAQSYYLGGKQAEAEVILKELVERFRNIGGPDSPDLLSAQQILAYVYRRKGDLEHAAQLTLEIAESFRRTSGPVHANTLGPLSTLAFYRLQLHQYADAEPIAREVLAGREKVMPKQWERFYSQSLLGESLTGQGRYAEAEPLVLSGYTGLIEREKTIPAASRTNLTFAGEAVVRLYESWGKPEIAAQWRQKLQSAAIR